MLIKALEKAGWNQSRAAIILGITRDTLRYRMKKFQLQAPGQPHAEANTWRN